jgi:hypothetical protein
MPNNILITLFICVVTSAPITCGAQTCPSSKAPGWSEQLRQLYADCSNSVHSPDGAIVFQIGPEERIRLLNGGHPLSTSGDERLTLPAVISWSPLSTSFFLNDGNGSGLSSQLRLFRIAASTVKESNKVNGLVTQIYRDRNRCNRSSDNPNVYGIGWSVDGKLLYVIAQATVNAPCGNPSDYLGFVVNVNTYEVERTLSAEQTKAEFGQLLPTELR